MHFKPLGKNSALWWHINQRKFGFGEFFHLKPLPYKPTARIPLFVSHLIIRCANIARGRGGGFDTFTVCFGVIFFCQSKDWQLPARLLGINWPGESKNVMLPPRRSESKWRADRQFCTPPTEANVRPNTPPSISHRMGLKWAWSKISVRCLTFYSNWQ